MCISTGWLVVELFLNAKPIDLSKLSEVLVNPPMWNLLPLVFIYSSIFSYGSDSPLYKFVVDQSSSDSVSFSLYFSALETIIDSASASGPKV